ncbi:MAG: protein kinase [Gemmatimonadaceae bacterium]|nr:protein kinase [Gemmatimonadaceae bacterium]
MTLPQPPQEPITIGKYQVLELAGEGAMGSVYRARDTVLGRTVAIKVMNATIARDQSLRDRFLREAQSAGSLQHPNVVTIFDFGEVDGHLFIAMEYVDGSDLETLLAQQNGLTLQARLEIIIDVLAGLEYAHQHGIVHRDLKPANIRVTTEPRGKLMDFGVAHLESQKLTQTGVMIGTPNYMAPEYISGKPVTGSSDIFSMGAVLYEVITGRKPFQGDTLHALLFAVVQEEPPAPSTLVPGLPASLDAVVQKAMAKDPANRFASAIEMAHALTGIRASLSGPSYNDSMALSTTLAHKVASKGADAAREAVARTAAAAASTAARANAAAAAASTPSMAQNAVSAKPANNTTRTVLIGVAAVAVLAVGGIALTRDSASGEAVDSSATQVATAAPETAPQPAVDASAGTASVPQASAPAASAVNSAPVSGAPANTKSSEPQRSSVPVATPTKQTATATPSSTPPSSVAAATTERVTEPPPVTQSSPPVSAPVVPPPTTAAAEPPSSAPASAPVASAASVQNELRESIARYARAISSRDINAVRTAYPGISRDQQQGFERFFSSTKSLQAALSLSGLDVRDRTAEGRVSGTYEFVTSGGRKELQMVSFRAQFEREGDHWRLMSVR